MMLSLRRIVFIYCFSGFNRFYRLRVSIWA